MLFLCPPSSYSLRPPQSPLSSLKPRRSLSTSSQPAHRYLKPVLKSHNYTKYLHIISQCWNVCLRSRQIQNLVLCSQQGAVASSSSSSSTPQPQLHGLSVKQSSIGATQLALPSLPVPQLKSPCSQSQSQQGVKTGLTDVLSEPATTNDCVGEMSARVISVSHSMSSATNHPLINNGKKAIVVIYCLLTLYYTIWLWYLFIFLSSCTVTAKWN